jgi:uncharacterized protein
MTRKHMLWITALVLVASALAGVGAPRLTHAGTRASAAADAHAQTTGGTLTVTGVGNVTTTPDTAQISAGVTTQGTTAQEALRENSAEMAKVVAALKAHGIDPKDLQTGAVSLQPRTDDNGDRVPGYTASNDVAAVIRDLGQLGADIDAAVSAGATNVSGPSLSRGDQDELYVQALRKAAAQARAKATALAQAAGVSLGELKSAAEGGVAQPYESTGAMFADAPRTQVPIEAGSTQVSASVTLVFAVS